jgi:hypothetical protein
MYQFKKILRCKKGVGGQWLMPVIPAIQEAEIRRIVVQRQPYLKKTYHKKGLVEWLKW